MDAQSAMADGFKKLESCYEAFAKVYKAAEKFSHKLDLSVQLEEGIFKTNTAEFETLLPKAQIMFDDMAFLCGAR